MTLTSMHLAGAFLAASAFIAAVLLTAPNLKVGVARMGAIVKVTCHVAPIPPVQCSRHLWQRSACELLADRYRRATLKSPAPANDENQA